MDSTTTTMTVQTTTGARTKITVGIADDNAVVRMGIRSLLATTDDIQVIGEAGDGSSAVAMVKAKRPDVMLLDVRMPRQDGVSAAVEIAHLTNVVMLTYSEANEVITAAVQAGVKGYLVHGHFSENELINSVRMAAGGLGTFSATALAALSNPRPTVAARADRFGLSEREAEVMEMISGGAANADLARALFISEKTVKNHINRIFAKLQVTHRGQAVSLWLSAH